MSAQIYEFLPRALYDEKKQAALARQQNEPLLPRHAPADLYKLLLENSFGLVDELIQFYRKMGIVWTPQADALMRNVITELNTICIDISGVTTNGQTEEGRHTSAEEGAGEHDGTAERSGDVADAGGATGDRNPQSE